MNPTQRRPPGVPQPVPPQGEAVGPGPAPVRLTPMMRQYLELKQAHPDAILMFRLGDFYEMFFEDAQVASGILEITLTSRDKGEDAVPMCGVPWHAVRGYVAKLVENGFKVAICDQVEDPRLAKGIVKREVTQVVTPGLVADLELLEAKAPHYLLAVVAGRKSVGFAYADITTGEFQLGEAEGWGRVAEEAARLEPRELLLQADGDDAACGDSFARTARRTVLEPARFELAAAADALSRHFGVSHLEGFGVADLPEGLRAAGAVLAYVEANHRGALANLRTVRRHNAGDAMILDEASKRNLEIFQTLSGDRRAGTLFHLVDRTRTSMGGRRLRRWMSFPLLDPEGIDLRLDAVSELVRRGDCRRRVRESLRAVADVERLSGKVAMASANARDLLALKVSLQTLPVLAAALRAPESALLAGVAEGLEGAGLSEAVDLLERAIADDPPALLTEGGLLKDGFDPEVDDLRLAQRDGRGWIARLQAQEREATGIGSLKVGFNRVFGYYIEVTRPNVGLVPSRFERRQTLANAERYVTPELKEMEAKVLGAEERCRTLEYERFAALRTELARYLDGFRVAADALAALDAVAGLADLAVEHGYVRPKVDGGLGVEIRGGRHPVVEGLGSGERFVPNDVRLGGEQGQEEAPHLLIITGPNMAGKSTILRQTALIALLAQMGSFVPAESASLGIVDRIFTRVGASDDLTRGRSTFMVEMTETANILNNATARSLVVVDEIGRGTSTFDGLSIAWAVAEHLHDLGARTLFATHYHELTDLARTLKGVANFNVAVKEWGGQVIFLRRLVEGGVSRSYGIQVARLAGLPAKVVSRAKEILGNLEAEELDEAGRPRLALSSRVRPDASRRQLDLFQSTTERRKDRLLEEVAGTRVEELTPVEALVRLQEFREKARAALGRGEESV